MVHQYLVFAASSLYNSLVNHTYDVVIAGIDPPNDANLYQAVLGALLLLVADTLGRVLIGSGALPVGVITSFLGAPMFLYLLVRGYK